MTDEVKVCLSRHAYTDRSYSKIRLMTPNNPQTVKTESQIFADITSKLVWNSTMKESIILRVRFLTPTKTTEISESTLKKRREVQRIVEKHINKANFASIKFKFLDDADKQTTAHIRVTLNTDQGSWSAIGRDALEYVDMEVATMNLSWISVGNVLHQFTHAMGFMHENKYISPNELQWNENVVEAAFAGFPHLWSPEETKRNFFDVFNINQFLNLSQFNPQSIMINILPCEFFKKIPPPDTLPCTTEATILPSGYSDLDKQAIQSYYPILENQPVLIPPLATDDKEQEYEWGNVVIFPDLVETTHTRPIAHTQHNTATDEQIAFDITERKDIPDNQRINHKWIYTLWIILGVLFIILVVMAIYVLGRRCRLVI